MRGPVAIAALYKEIIVTFGIATAASVHSEALRVDHDLTFESGEAETHFLNGTVPRVLIVKLLRQLGECVAHLRRSLIEVIHVVRRETAAQRIDCGHEIC